MTLSRQLVRLMRDKRARGIPDHIYDKSLLHIRDTIGIAVAATEGAPAAANTIAGLLDSSNGPCAIIGRRETLPPAYAAFANSALAHAMDFDDIHDMARIHPTAVTFPAALAAAQIANAPGSLVVESVAMGNELMCRFGAMMKPVAKGPGGDWFLSQFFGYLGACLTASIVLDLDEDQAVSALGLAYMQLAGGKEPAIGVGATSRAVYTGFAAMGGVQAALLARAGLIGPDTALDGTAGLFALYFNRPLTKEDVAFLLDEAAWVWTQTALKPWPSCRASHSYVLAGMQLEEDVRPDDIAKVSVDVTASGAKLCTPLPARKKPATLQDAKYSIPFVTAFTLVKRDVDLLNLTEEAVFDPAVLKVADRIEISQSLDDIPGLRQGRIAVTLKDGSQRVYSQRGEIAFGVPKAEQKFLKCYQYARKPEGAAAWDTLGGLGKLDMRSLRDCLSH